MGFAFSTMLMLRVQFFRDQLCQFPSQCDLNLVTNLLEIVYFNAIVVFLQHV